MRPSTGLTASAALARPSSHLLGSGDKGKPARVASALAARSGTPRPSTVTSCEWVQSQACARADGALQVGLHALAQRQLRGRGIGESLQRSIQAARRLCAGALGSRSRRQADTRPLRTRLPGVHGAFAPSLLSKPMQ
jgi:hypothetical protein